VPAAASGADGSVTPAQETWAVAPSFTGPLLARVALGATLVTVTVAS
jgi:hypothetical protein